MPWMCFRYRCTVAFSYGFGNKRGDEVITTPYTFATASVVSRLGARPVFVDIDPVTYNIDIDKIYDHITPKTKAVIVVHLFGHMAQVEKIEGFLRDKGIYLIEDCAQSFGAWRKIDDDIRYCGTIGTLGCFSFYPTKNLGGYGDGGLVTTNDDYLADRIRKLRVHGLCGEYVHEELGMNSRLDAIQAAILRCRLPHVDEWNKQRRIIAERYRILFDTYGISEFVKSPHEDTDGYHVFHQYVVRCDKRDELMKYLAENGVGTRVYYPCPYICSRHSALWDTIGRFSQAEALSKTVIFADVSRIIA